MGKFNLKDQLAGVAALIAAIVGTLQSSIKLKQLFRLSSALSALSKDIIFLSFKSAPAQKLFVNEWIITILQLALLFIYTRIEKIYQWIDIIIIIKINFF